MPYAFAASAVIGHVFLPHPSEYLNWRNADMITSEPRAEERQRTALGPKVRMDVGACVRLQPCSHLILLHRGSAGRSGPARDADAGWHRRHPSECWGGAAGRIVPARWQM